MLYHFALCDDEPAELTYLSAMVNRWALQQNHIACLTCFPSSEAFLFTYEDDKRYDIMVLDIEMGKTSGVALAKKIRSENKTVQIIFVTGYMEYITEGYEVEALHYLLKPVTEEKFFDVLNRAAEKLALQEKTLLLHTHGESVRLPLHDIRYIEARRNYLTVYAKDEYTIKQPLREFEKGLDEFFLRTGRSFIVNIKHIYKVTRMDIILYDGTVLPLPRGQYDAVNKALIERL